MPVRFGPSRAGSHGALAYLSDLRDGTILTPSKVFIKPGEGGGRRSNALKDCRMVPKHGQVAYAGSSNPHKTSPKVVISQVRGADSKGGAFLTFHARLARIASLHA
jgi:hypothetical protein